MRKFRVLILLGIISFGAYKGGPFGALYAFIGVGIVLLVVYMALDCFHAVASFLQRQGGTTNYTTHNELKIEPAIKGKPMSEEEWAGFIETARQQGRIPRL